MQISNSRTQPPKLKQVSATIISNILLIEYPVSGRLSSGPPSVTFHLLCAEAPDIASIAQPGQFVTVSCDSELVLRRPLSIHRVENSNKLYLLFAVVGKGTKWLSQRQKGETINLLGPLGNGFSIPEERRLLLVAGGIGIAPLIFLAQQALKKKNSVKLLLGARNQKALYPKIFLPTGIETSFAIEDATEDISHGNIIEGMITEILADPLSKRELVDWADQIYICGPQAMYKAIEEQKQRWQEKKTIQVLLEVRMGCGLGSCYGCSIQTTRGMKKVCQDGPVFNLDEILWQEVNI